MHAVTIRVKRSAGYTLDDGREVEPHDLHRWVCDCGEKGGVWYADKERALTAYRRHLASDLARTHMTPPVENVAEWLRHKAQYTSSLGMSSVRTELEHGNLAGALYALATIAEREARRAL